MTPIGPILGVLLALVVLILLLWGIKEPLVWIVVAFLAIGLGVGCLGFGVSKALLLSEPRTSQAVEQASMFIGGGAGGTVGGAVLLVVALLRRRKSPNPNA